MFVATQRRIAQRLRKLVGPAGAVMALLLCAVVLVDVSQAGRRYVYCETMQEVMSHACCGHAASQRPTAAALLSARSPDCCQTRFIASLDLWKPAPRPAELVGPALAVAVLSPVELVSSPNAAALSGRDPNMRTGPPRSRALAWLMVLRI